MPQFDDKSISDDGVSDLFADFGDFDDFLEDKLLAHPNLEIFTGIGDEDFALLETFNEDAENDSQQIENDSEDKDDEDEEQEEDQEEEPEDEGLDISVDSNPCELNASKSTKNSPSMPSSYLQETHRHLDVSRSQFHPGASSSVSPMDDYKESLPSPHISHRNLDTSTTKPINTTTNHLHTKSITSESPQVSGKRTIQEISDGKLESKRKIVPRRKRKKLTRKERLKLIRQLAVPKDDIRRFYLKGLADAFNSGDLKILSDLMEKYCEEDCVAVERCVGDRTSDHMPGYVEVRGLVSVINHFTEMHYSAPDAVLMFIETKIRVREHSCCVVGSFTMKGTGLYQVFLKETNTMTTVPPSSSHSSRMDSAALNDRKITREGKREADNHPFSTDSVPSSVSQPSQKQSFPHREQQEQQPQVDSLVNSSLASETPRPHADALISSESDFQKKRQHSLTDHLLNSKRYKTWRKFNDKMIDRAVITVKDLFEASNDMYTSAPSIDSMGTITLHINQNKKIFKFVMEYKMA